MDPHSQWCHNRRCRAYGRIGEGHIVIHSQKERRYRCKRCGSGEPSPKPPTLSSTAYTSRSGWWLRW